MYFSSDFLHVIYNLYKYVTLKHDSIKTVAGLNLLIILCKTFPVYK